MNKNKSVKESSVERSATVKAKDLPSAERQWFAIVLGVELADEDEFTVSLRRPAIRIPAPNEREAAREGLRTVLGQFHERMKDEPGRPNHRCYR